MHFCEKPSSGSESCLSGWLKHLLSIATYYTTAYYPQENPTTRLTVVPLLIVMPHGTSALHLLIDDLAIHKNLRLLINQTPDQSDPERMNHQLHLLDKRSSLHDCVVCSSRLVKRRRTPYFCKTCSNTPYLCPHPCFERYHTLRRYRL